MSCFIFAISKSKLIACAFVLIYTGTRLFAQSCEDSLLMAINVNAVNIFGELHSNKKNTELEIRLIEKQAPRVNQVLSLQEWPPSVLYDIITDLKSNNLDWLEKKWNHVPEIQYKLLEYKRMLDEGVNLDFYPVDLEDDRQEIAMALSKLASGYNSSTGSDLMWYSKKYGMAMTSKREKRFSDSISKFVGLLLEEKVLSPFDSLWLKRLLAGKCEFSEVKKLNKTERKRLRESYIKRHLEEVIARISDTDSVFVYGFFGMAHVSKGINKYEDTKWHSALQLIEQDSFLAPKVRTSLILYKFRPDNKYYHHILSNMLSPTVAETLLDISLKQILWGTFPGLNRYYDYFINVDRL